MASKMFSKVVIIFFLIQCHQVFSERLNLNFNDKELFEGDNCEIENYEAIPGVCKPLNECPSILEKIKTRIFDHKVCGYDKTVQIVCCPHANKLPNKPPLVNEGENCVYNTLTGEIGTLKQDLNCPSNETYKLFNGLVCCPNTIQPHTFDECLNMNEQMWITEFLGPKCFDPQTGRTGLCRPLAQTQPFNRVISELAKCGTYCCEDFYCFPHMDTEMVTTKSVSRQKCESQHQRKFSAQKTIPIETFRSSVPCNSSETLSQNETECLSLNHNDIPHLAILGFLISENNIFWNCAGVLISDKFILTSAGCLTQNKLGPLTKVRLGGNSEQTLRYYDVENKFHHPNFDRDMKYNDVGLVQLTETVEFNNYISPICLPATPELPLKIHSIGLKGGHITDNDIGRLTILHARQDIITSEECNVLYGNSIDVRFGNGFDDSSQVCVALDCKMRGTCQFNLGRLIINDASLFGNQHEIYGVASRGVLCNGQSEIYTKVYPFLEWIEGIVWPSPVVNVRLSLSRFGEDDDE